MSTGLNHNLTRMIQNKQNKVIVQNVAGGWLRAYSNGHVNVDVNVSLFKDSSKVGTFQLRFQCTEDFKN